MTRGKRNTSDHCKFCDQPRHVYPGGSVSPYCIQHQREYDNHRNAERRRKEAANAPADHTCSLCGRTRAEAEQWASVNVTCSRCRVQPAHHTAHVELMPGGTTALLVDAETKTIQRIRIVVEGTEPLPGAADMRNRMFQADAADAPILIRHKLTKGGNHA